MPLLEVPWCVRGNCVILIQTGKTKLWFHHYSKSLYPITVVTQLLQGSTFIFHVELANIPVWVISWQRECEQFFFKQKVNWSNRNQLAFLIQLKILYFCFPSLLKLFLTTFNRSLCYVRREIHLPKFHSFDIPSTSSSSAQEQCCTFISSTLTMAPTFFQ